MLAFVVKNGANPIIEPYKAAPSSHHLQQYVHLPISPNQNHQKK
jgi:hypothetical protein